MGKLEIYGFTGSPPTKAVILTAEILGLPYELKDVDFYKAEHKTAAFKKINPQAHMPVLNDNGFVLQESRAILEYLIDTYAKDDSLLPKDTKAKSVVRARLYLDCGTLWPRMAIGWAELEETKKVSEKTTKSIEEAIQMVEDYLGRDKWIAGSKPTVADLSLASTVQAFEYFSSLDLTKFPKLKTWFENCKKEIPKLAEFYLPKPEELADKLKAKSALTKWVP